MKLRQLLLPLQNNNPRLLQVLKPLLPTLRLQVLVLPRTCLALPPRLTQSRLPKANPLQPVWHGSLQQSPVTSSTNDRLVKR